MASTSRQSLHQIDHRSVPRKNRLGSAPREQQRARNLTLGGFDQLQQVLGAEPPCRLGAFEEGLGEVALDPVERDDPLLDGIPGHKPVDGDGAKLADPGALSRNSKACRLAG